MLFRPDMGRLVAAELCLTLGPGWMSALYLFFMRDVMGFGLAPASLLLLGLSAEESPLALLDRDVMQQIVSRARPDAIKIVF